MAVATSSLPVPLSPVINTGTFWAGHVADGFVNLAHGRTGADDRACRHRLRGRAANHSGVHACDERRPALADHSLELAEIERLE